MNFARNDGVAFDAAGVFDQPGELRFHRNSVAWSNTGRRKKKKKNATVKSDLYRCNRIDQRPRRRVIANLLSNDIVNVISLKKFGRSRPTVNGSFALHARSCKSPASTRTWPIIAWNQDCLFFFFFVQGITRGSDKCNKVSLDVTAFF